MKCTPMSEALYAYMLDISVHEHPILKALREETAALELASMQIPQEQGQFLQFLMKLIGAKKVLELGTFTGYSALAMALALPEDGLLITCDRNPEWTQYAEKYWSLAGLRQKIELRLAPALESLKDLVKQGYQNQFDLIFIDADKTNYLAYYEYALNLVSDKGLIAIDNIFWEGQVIDAEDESAQTRAIRRLNDFIRQDTRVDVSLLNIADGLFLVRRR